MTEASRRTRRAWHILLGITLSLFAVGSHAAPYTPRNVDPGALLGGPPLINGSKTRLLDIPQAENSLFTNTGRLFVSGGKNVYEVVRDSAAPSGYRAVAQSAVEDNFTGIAQQGNVLYVAAFSGALYAEHLDAPTPDLHVISTLNMNAPNGMALGADGSLYIANGPFPSGSLPNPKIERLRFAATDPLTVIDEQTWIGHGLLAPNGVRIKGNTLYLTDSSLLPLSLTVVRRVDIQADGSPGPLSTFASLDDSIPDDLSADGSGWLLAEFTRGGIATIDGNGNITGETAAHTFASTSSVRRGQPPLFSSTDWVVTEKGSLLGDGQSSTGNALSLFTPTP